MKLKVVTPRFPSIYRVQFLEHLELMAQPQFEFHKNQTMDTDEEEDFTDNNYTIHTEAELSPSEVFKYYTCDMYCKSRATYPEQASQWTSEGAHPDQKVAKMRFQHFSYRWLST